MAVKQLYINGTGSGTYKVYINSDTYLNSPTLDFNEYQIPAVDGNLITYNKRLNNVVRRFDCFIKDNPVSNLEAFKKLIYNNTGYMKLESDYDSDTYQYGYLAQEIQVEPFNDTSEIKFSLYFSCKPQKWFKTNTSGNRFDIPSLGGIWKIEKGSNSMLKREFANIPVDSQPNEPYYLVYVVKTQLAQQTITNISATNSKGGFVAVTVDSWHGTSRFTETKTLCYGNGSASLDSYTFTDTTSQVHVVTEITPGATITGSITTTDGVESFTSNLANAESTISNSNAFGVALTNELEYYMRAGDTIVENGLVLTGYLNDVEISRALVFIHFTEMSEDLRTTLLNDYTDSNHLIKVTIDSDFNVYATKGTNKIELTSLSEIIGDIDGRCDKIVATYFGNYGNTGGLDYATMKPEWWKL